MALTDLAAVSNQIQKVWAPLFTKELREQLLLGSLINKDYQGEIKKLNDTVYVSQIIAPAGQLKTVGTDADSFDSEVLSTSRITIAANKRAVAAFEIDDLVDLQSQLGDQDSEIRASLKFAVEKQVNDYLYTLAVASTSNPDHDVSGVTDFNAAQIANVRLLAATAKWDKSKPWYILASPSYYSDILNSSTLMSSDYGASDAPLIGGNVALNRYGFQIYEDNSRGTDLAYCFHPDFMHLVMQKEAQFKLSDLHGQKKFSYLLSVDIVFGAALGIGGSKKLIKVYNS